MEIYLKFADISWSNKSAQFLHKGFQTLISVPRIVDHGVVPQVIAVRIILIKNPKDQIQITIDDGNKIKTRHYRRDRQRAAAASSEGK